MSIKDMMVGHTTAAKSSRDFVTENAISAILASPRTKQKAAEQNWLASKNFAKRPAYLDRIAAQLAGEREYVLELADAQQRDAARSASGGAAREMAADERADLIAQLKAKWSEVSAVRFAAAPALLRGRGRRRARPKRVARQGNQGSHSPHRRTPTPTALAALQPVCAPQDLNHKLLRGRDPPQGELRAPHGQAGERHT